MIMEEKIFSENPEDDLWREILQYSYKANVIKYFKDHNFQEDENTINCVIGSILQAHEYYLASKHANLQISPLLLYYGTTNLLYGISALIKGKILSIENHGMKIDLSTKNNHISETSISFLSPETGGVHQFLKSFDFKDDLTKYGKWNLKEFLSSIAEINSDYIKCYSESYGNTVNLDIYKTPSGTIERLYYKKEEIQQLSEILERVADFDKSYLSPQPGHDLTSDKDFLILRQKMNSSNIKHISFSGQPYLQAGIPKQHKLITLPTMFNMYIALFVLASLCRYHPEIWGPFVLSDETGEKLLYEKLMYYSRRIIPNLILNKLYSKKITYANQAYVENETIKHVGEHEVKELIKQELFEIEQRKKFIK